MMLTSRILLKWICLVLPAVAVVVVSGARVVAGRVAAGSVAADSAVADLVVVAEVFLLASNRGSAKQIQSVLTTMISGEASSKSAAAIFSITVKTAIVKC